MLHIKNLEIIIENNNDNLKPVDKVSIKINKGEILGLVGESGSGKSLTALSILKLNNPPIKVSSGHIEYKNKNILNYTDTEMKNIRGKEISMIFQNPRESLNPVFRISDQLINIYQTHMKGSKKEAFDKKAFHYLKIYMSSQSLLIFWNRDECILTIISAINNL